MAATMFAEARVYEWAVPWQGPDDWPQEVEYLRPGSIVLPPEGRVPLCLNHDAAKVVGTVHAIAADDAWLYALIEVDEGHLATDWRGRNPQLSVSCRRRMPAYLTEALTAGTIDHRLATSALRAEPLTLDEISLTGRPLVRSTRVNCWGEAAFRRWPEHRHLYRDHEGVAS